LKFRSFQRVEKLTENSLELKSVKRLKGILRTGGDGGT
jgi:hypothetical protein